MWTTGLNIVAAIAVLIWVLALVNAHLRRARLLEWDEEPISAYLTGKASGAVDVGFYALAIGLFCLAVLGPMSAAVFYVLAGLGTAGACVTRAVWPDDDWHHISAGLAFGGIGIANLLAAWPDPWLFGIALAAPVVALANLALRANVAIQEKTVAGCFLVSLWAMTIGSVV